MNPQSCREDAKSEERLADHGTVELGAQPSSGGRDFLRTDEALRPLRAPPLPGKRR